jgi:hypothetical protein
LLPTTAHCSCAAHREAQADLACELLGQARLHQVRDRAGGERRGLAKKSGKRTLKDLDAKGKGRQIKGRRHQTVQISCVGSGR